MKHLNRLKMFGLLLLIAASTNCSSKKILLRWDENDDEGLTEKYQAYMVVNNDTTVKTTTEDFALFPYRSGVEHRLFVRAWGNNKLSEPSNVIVINPQPVSKVDTLFYDELQEGGLAGGASKFSETRWIQIKANDPGHIAFDVSDVSKVGLIYEWNSNIPFNLKIYLNGNLVKDGSVNLEATSNNYLYGFEKDISGRIRFRLESSDILIVKWFLIGG